MSNPFRPPNLALTTVGLSLATFMQVLDTTIANVSLPTIAGNLGVSVNQSTWVITSFAVSMAIALPLTGFLTRRFGEVKLFIWSTLLFSMASFLCGIAQSMPMLIVFRAIQGAVAGPMYPITQSLLISIYPPAKRGMALALLAMVTVVAPIAGPILGGWITDNYSWPWIFFINVPIGIFASMVVGNQMKLRVDTTTRPKVDYVGLITLIVGVGALQIVLDKGNDEDWFNSTFIIITSIVSAISLAVFLIWELTDKDPIVNLRLFRHHNFRIGTISLVLAYAAFFAIGLLVPQWLQRNMGYTSTWAGFAAAPLGILPVMLTFMVGKYAGRTDMRLLASCAFLVMGVTCFMRSNFFLQVDFMHIAGAQLFQGLGRGAVLHAGDDHPAVRPCTQRDRRGRWPGHLPAHAGRQLLRLAHHFPVGSPRHRASRAPERAHHRVRHVGAGNAAIGGRQCGVHQRHAGPDDHPAGLPDLVQRGVPLAGLGIPQPDRGGLAGPPAVLGQGRSWRRSLIRSDVQTKTAPFGAVFLFDESHCDCASILLRQNCMPCMSTIRCTFCRCNSSSLGCVTGVAGAGRLAVCGWSVPV